jgi:CBS domain-containing protein
MMSDRDILVARACADDGEWWRVPVHFVMKSPAQTAGPDDSLTQIAARLAAAKISAFPIVQLGKLLGIVTVTDVLEAEVREAMGNAGAASSMT